VAKLAAFRLLAFSLCVPTPLFAQANVTDALQATLPKGWECLQGPNELDRPGRTFYTDQSGIRYELADLYSRLKPVTGVVSSVAAQAKGQVSAGLMAKMFGIGSASASASGKYATAVSLLERQEVRTDEADIRAALRTLDPALIDPKNTYYVIRNVQLARQIRLSIDRGIAADFGGEATFRGLFSVSGAKSPGAAGRSAPIITAEDGASFTIDQTFDKPLTICYLAQKFTLKQVSGGAGGSIRDAQLIEEYFNPSGLP
jgi:hypothetical protein